MRMVQSDYYLTASLADFGFAGAPPATVLPIWIGDMTPEYTRTDQDLFEITGWAGLPGGWTVGLGEPKGYPQAGALGVYVFATVGTLASFQCVVEFREVTTDQFSGKPVTIKFQTKAEFSLLNIPGGVYVSGPGTVRLRPQVPFSIVLDKTGRSSEPNVADAWSVQYGQTNTQPSGDPLFRSRTTAGNLGAFGLEVRSVGKIPGNVGDDTVLLSEGTYSYTASFAGLRPDDGEPQSNSRNVRIFVTEPIVLEEAGGLPVIPPGGGGGKPDKPYEPTLLVAPQYVISVDCVDPCQAIGAPHLYPLVEVKE